MPLLKNITPGTHKLPLLCKKAFKEILSVELFKTKRTIIQQTSLVSVELNAFSLAVMHKLKADSIQILIFISETYHRNTLISMYLQLTRGSSIPTFIVTNYLHRSYRSPARSITQLYDIHEAMPPLKGFGPAVSSSLMPRHSLHGPA